MVSILLRIKLHCYNKVLSLVQFSFIFFQVKITLREQKVSDLSLEPNQPQTHDLQDLSLSHKNVEYDRE